MRVIGVVILAALLGMSGGCTHITADTSQFYVAQDYLPLPSSARAATVNGTLPSNGCASGPIIARHRLPAERDTAQVLPGMTLRVTQTSYAASRQGAAVPLIATWQWTVPTSAVSDPRNTCADDAGAVPGWTRDDLLRVRSLLSGAQLTDGQAHKQPVYFEEAITAACAGATGNGVGLACAEDTFLNRFVGGLALDVRAQGAEQEGDPNAQPPPGKPFEPAVPTNVLAATGSPTAGSSGYAVWYSGLSGFRFPADLFGGGLQAERCRGPFRDRGVPGEAPPAQDAAVCKFAQTSLEWSAPAQALRMPGATLQQIGRLGLLRSGDPLLLFQPQNYREALDTGNDQPCGGDPNCLLRDRVMQGFTDIVLLIPVTVEHGKRRWVPVGMSVAAYEAANGVVVRRLRRSVDWLPRDLSFEDGKKRPAQKLAGAGHRVDLRFIGTGGGGEDGGGVVIRGAKADFLFAPGDILSVRRP